MMKDDKSQATTLSPIRSFFSAAAKAKEARIQIGESELRVSLAKLPLERLAEKFERRGIFSPEILAERVLAGVNVSEEAERLGVEPLQLGALYQAAIDAVPKDFIERVREDLSRPRGLGELDPSDPDYDLRIRELGIDKIRVVPKDQLLKWADRWWFPELLPRGPISAVDHRPFLGPARNQGGRGTCTSFGSTCVTEALEYFRDPRTGPRDFAEQLIFWYSKGGQLYTAGGYGCGAALRHHSEYGTCEEFFFPYNTKQLATNHAQVPMPDEAMDRAKFFRTGNVVGIPARDVEAMKSVLRTGRCAGIIHDATDWNTSTGTYTFPDPLDSKGIGGNHCTAIIGYIDRDDLPSEFEGGYFIQRNSWGGAGSTTNVMGPEYGGHLLMPYGWYRRYTHSAFTLEDIGSAGAHERKWLVEYFSNENLQGAPIERGEVVISVLGMSIGASVNVPELVDEVDFDWGSGSALRFSLPPFGALDALPKDHFSARFTKVKRFRNGWYRFRLRGDDGIRLWVDDTLVINAWKPQAATEYTAEHHLKGGDHVLRVEYYERAGDAEVTLDIEAVNFTFNLFSNTTLDGTPASTFTDTLTDLEWRHAPPVTSRQNGHFSVRGRACLNFEAGDYQFHSIHTGGCRIYLDDEIVLDDWNGNDHTGPVHSVSAGLHDVRLEFKHEELVPAPGVKGIYRAALNFGWSNAEWQADFYNDERREAFAGGERKPDDEYVAWRTLSLDADPIYRRSYAASHTAAGEYLTTDGIPLRIAINKPEKFAGDLEGGPALTGHYHSAWIRRRVFIPETGYYNIRFSGGAASRIVINGKQVLEDHVGSTPKVAEDVFVKAGVHDFGIEWAVSKWSKKLDFRMDRVAWSVQYYDGIDFDSLATTQTVDSIGKVIEQRPVDAVGDNTFSLRAKRTISLPLGRYRFQVRTDDGARLKINGITQIDAWLDQGPANYTYEMDHNGGDVRLELEYYQKYGGSALDFEFRPIGYYAEYYRGTTLQAAPDGGDLDRNVPIAYRFDPAIDFDWGAGNQLNRAGSNHFSVRWRGMVDLPVGRWNAVLRADDGVRVFVDGRLLIDEWKTQSAKTYDRMIDLVGRQHEVVVEYFEKTGNAVCQLRFDRLF